MIKHLMVLSLIELSISGATLQETRPRTLQEARSKYRGSEVKHSHWLLSESSSFSILRVTSDLIALQPTLDKQSQRIFGRFWFEQWNGKAGTFHFAMILEPYRYSPMDDQVKLMIEASKFQITLKPEAAAGVWSVEVPSEQVIRMSMENTGLILAGGTIQISVKIPKEIMKSFLDKVPK